jgi:hypothetical protein
MRIRTIKPEFWRNEDLARLSDFTRLLAVALLNFADDEGYFIATPAIVRGELFPFMEDSRSIQVGLTELSNAQYVRLYTGVNGRIYGFVTNFSKHQIINKPTPSRIKGLINFSEDYGSPQVALRESYNTEQGTGNREQGTCLVPGLLPGVLASKASESEAKAPAKKREPNPLFDALAEESGKRGELTKSEGGAIGEALKQIRAASPDLTPEMIHTRAAKYRQTYRGMACTAMALAAHWSEFAARQPHPTAEPLKEPVGWREVVQDSQYGPGGAFPANSWAELPRDTQQFCIDRINEGIG